MRYGPPQDQLPTSLLVFTLLLALALLFDTLGIAYLLLKSF